MIAGPQRKGYKISKAIKERRALIFSRLVSHRATRTILELNNLLYVLLTSSSRTHRSRTEQQRRERERATATATATATASVTTCARARVSTKEKRSEEQEHQNRVESSSDIKTRVFAGTSRGTGVSGSDESVPHCGSSARSSTLSASSPAIAAAAASRPAIGAG